MASIDNEQKEFFAYNVRGLLNFEEDDMDVKTFEMTITNTDITETTKQLAELSSSAEAIPVLNSCLSWFNENKDTILTSTVSVEYSNEQYGKYYFFEQSLEYSAVQNFGNTDIEVLSTIGYGISALYGDTLNDKNIMWSIGTSTDTDSGEKQYTMSSAIYGLANPFSETLIWSLKLKLNVYYKKGDN